MTAKERICDIVAKGILTRNQSKNLMVAVEWIAQAILDILPEVKEE